MPKTIVSAVLDENKVENRPSVAGTKWTFPAKKRTVSAYTKGLPASKKSAIRRLFVDRAGLKAGEPLSCGNDERRAILEQILFEVADEIENRLERPTDVSRKIHDARCDVHEDIQQNRDDFW